MNNVINLCQYRREREIEILFLEFEKELASLGRRLHWDFVTFDQEFRQTTVWGLTHEQIISAKK